MFLWVMPSTESEINLFNNIVQKYKNLFYSVAFKIVKDNFLAEDIVQESLFKIADNFDFINSIKVKRLLPYLVSVVRNTALNALKSNKTTFNIVNEDGEEYFSDPDSDILSKLNDKEDMIEIRDALLKLKSDYFEILMMRYYYDMDYDKIAQELSITNENARKKVSRAKIELKKILKEGIDL